MLIGALFGFNVGRLLFGSSPRSKHYRQNTGRRQNEKSQSAPKIIRKEEGEYVDFEEIKD